jgi:hypothetical protein
MYPLDDNPFDGVADMSKAKATVVFISLMGAANSPWVNSIIFQGKRAPEWVLPLGFFTPLSLFPEVRLRQRLRHRLVGLTIFLSILSNKVMLVSGKPIDPTKLVYSYFIYSFSSSINSKFFLFLYRILWHTGE